MISNILHNGLWLAANTYAAMRYRHALKTPRKVQENILTGFLNNNTDTLYGKKYGYAEINSVSSFQERVPVVSYDDLEPWVERIKEGEKCVLTREPVRFFETTSGSTGCEKFIPYTDSLIAQFRRSVSAWLFDMMITHPGMLAGSQYWSISPAGRKQKPVKCGLPVGIDNDATYLGLMAKIALRGVLAVPLNVASITDIDEWRRETIRHIKARQDLRFISVWNPSFLTLLIEAMPEPFNARAYWPDLQLISCWTSSSAQRSLSTLRKLLPGVEIQGKGLLASEGVVSIPLSGRPAPTIAVNSHFLEFLDNAGRPHLVDELETGKRYRVLMTTGSGFARYDLGDEVEVIAPLTIEFTGRRAVSDMCGEKLSEAFVNSVLPRTGLDGCFSMLVPEWGDTPRYILITDSEQYSEDAIEVEDGLMKSVHYGYCRRLGQLGPVEALYIPDAPERYMRACIGLGQSVGDIKPTALRTDSGWCERMVDYGHC